MSGTLLLVAAALAADVSFLPPGRVSVGGILGEALDAGTKGRLSKFVVDEKSPAVALFSAAERAANTSRGGWYGEHAGKWLITAARAAKRSNDPALAARVLAVADYLVGTQEGDGYLGTYAPSLRLTSDEAYNKRATWDVWVLGYMMLGLLETHREFGDPKYLEAAVRIGDLCERTLGSGNKSTAYMGNHVGASGAVLLEPIVELHRASREPRFLRFAETIVRQVDERNGLEIFARALAGMDLARIADGKAYQLTWNVVGLAKLGAVTGDARYLAAARNAWKSIRDRHLTPGGGPWGGIGVDSEVFSRPGFFSPGGFVETCSTMAWIQLNKELLRITGEAAFAEEIERAAYNDLLLAQDPNGEDWAYFVFPNGPRSNTYYWACCKSSGALALEEVAGAAYTRREKGLAIELYGPGGATFETGGATVRVTQRTEYPREGAVTIVVEPSAPATFSLFLRIPSWAEGATVSGRPAVPGAYAEVSRHWRAGDRIEAFFPMRLRALKATNAFRHADEEVIRQDYVSFARGPLVYAAGLIDGYKRSETVELPAGDPAALARPAKTPTGRRGPAFEFAPLRRKPLLLLPLYEADGRTNGAWHTTWFETVTASR